MESATFIALGALLLLGLLADEVGTRTRLPRVTLLILFGFLIGQSGFDLIPDALHAWYEFLATVALTMVAFLLGSKLSLPILRGNGREIFTVSLVVVVMTVVLVGGGLLALGFPLIWSLILAGIAAATAPAAIHDVVRQLHAKGPFTLALLGVVAIDDAWGLIVYSLLLTVAKAFDGDGGLDILAQSLWEVGGSLVLGAALGFPAAALTGRLRRGEPIQSEALGLVFLCAGLALWLEVSFLLTGMVVGAIITNFASHHQRAFHEIEHIEWPFMVLFFVLAGAGLELDSLATIGWLGLAYIVLRTVARLSGGWLGAVAARAPGSHRRWFGLALMPQAGVAIGMALVAGAHFPALQEPLLALVVGTTVIFELVGPPLTQLAIRAVGEDHPNGANGRPRRGRRPVPGADRKR